MIFPEPHSKVLPDYGFARSIGLVSGTDIDFTALANQLDCSRNFSQVGIIYSDGARQWLVRASRRIATPNESSVSHVVITKVGASSNNPVQATTNTIQSPSLTTEISSTAISCGAAAGLKSAALTYRLLNRSTSESVFSLLQKMGRADRARLTEEIIRIRNPGISNSGIKAAMTAGVYPKRYPSEALQSLLQRELMNAVTNSSAFIGSAILGTIRNPQNVTQSGKYIFGLIQSFSFTGSH